MGTREAKDALYDGFAGVAKALANGRRAEIVDLLSQAPRSVEDVAAEIGHSVANTSHHLGVLARAGLLRPERRGPRVIYSLAGGPVAFLWRAMRDVATERVAGIERLAAAYLGSRDGFEPVATPELARRMHAGAVTVIDVRPAVEYEAGHIVGARSIPLTELKRRLKTLPKRGRIVAYCRGPYCIFADEAVRLLQRSGFRATRLLEGFPEWREAGLPVAVGRG